MAIEKIRLATGEEISVEEWLTWPLFSTGIGQGNIQSPGGPLGAGGELRLFEYIVGDQIPVMGVPAGPIAMAGITDTNQVVRGKINHDEGFIVFNLTYEHFAEEHDPAFGAPANTDITVPSPVLSGINLRRLQRDMMLELTVGAGITKPQISAPLEYFGQGAGAVAYTSGDGLTVSIPNLPGPNITNIALDYGTAGPVSPNNQRRLQLPVKIDADRDMFVSLRVPSGAIKGLDQNWRLRVYMDGLKRRPVA